MKIFILEDDPARIDAFEHVLRVFDGGPHEVTICKWLGSADGAYARFDPPYDLYLFDHDLGGMAYVDSDGPEDTGYKFVKHILDKYAWGEWPLQQAVIHSYNPEGARRMENELLDSGQFTVQLEPFSRELLQALGRLQ